MNRRTFLVTSLAAAALSDVGAPASAGVLAFEPQAFAAAQEADEGIVVFVHAPW